MNFNFPAKVWKTTMDLPVFDITPFLSCPKKHDSDLENSSTRFILPFGVENGYVSHGNADSLQVCKEMANCLRKTGVLIIRDPRCTTKDCDVFLDMMEDYFQKTANFKLNQARPELHYQVGVTPEGIETPLSSLDPNLRSRMVEISEANRPHLPSGPDLKWRYMWRIGPRPLHTEFPELNAAPVIPDCLPNWSEVMDSWGQKLLDAVEVIAEMLAVGFDLPADAFTSLMKNGPHLLGPTGSDLRRYNKRGMVFAGYHYDLNFLTIHGKSRFPGLYVWLVDGTKVPVTMPDGCLLVQSGKQMEWLTGGDCLAGMHEVVVTEDTSDSITKAKMEGRSLWRVSSTVFGHIASDALLQPLHHFALSKNAHLYPPILAGKFVENEISRINLKKQASSSPSSSFTKHHA